MTTATSACSAPSWREKILAGRAPSTLPPVPPRKIRYSLNRKTAEQMKLELAGARRSATPRKWWSRIACATRRAQPRRQAAAAHHRRPCCSRRCSVLGVAAYRTVSDRFDRLSRKGETLAHMVAQNSEFAVYTQNADALRQIAQGLRADSEVAYVRFLGGRRTRALRRGAAARIRAAALLHGLPRTAAGHRAGTDRPSRPASQRVVDVTVPVGGAARRPAGCCRTT